MYSRVLEGGLGNHPRENIHVRERESVAWLLPHSNVSVGVSWDDLSSLVGSFIRV